MRAALGAGWNEPEFRAFGLPFDHRVSRFEEAFEIIRRLLAGERVTVRRPLRELDDAVLLPPPARHAAADGRRRPGRGCSRRRCRTSTWWNTWFTDYGNRADGLRALNARIDAACERAGRDPREVLRSACLLVEVEGGAGERPSQADAPALPLVGLADELSALEEAGADEAILVLDPITEESVLRTAAVTTLA